MHGFVIYSCDRVCSEEGVWSYYNLQNHLIGTVCSGEALPDFVRVRTAAFLNLRTWLGMSIDHGVVHNEQKLATIANGLIQNQFRYPIDVLKWDIRGKKQRRASWLIEW